MEREQGKLFHTNAKTPFSLLINPTDTIQWDMLDVLRVTSKVELWECDAQGTPLSQQLLNWPKMYRDTARRTLKGFHPSMEWHALIEKWKQASQSPHPPLEQKVENDVSHRLEDTAQQIVSPPPQTKEKLATAPPIPTASPAQTQEIPPAIWKQLQNANSLSLLLWRLSKDNVPECFIRVHSNFSVKKQKLSIQYGTPILKTYELEGSIILLPFKISMKKQSSTTGVSVFNPNSKVDRAILSGISKGPYIHLVCCRVNENNLLTTN